MLYKLVCFDMDGVLYSSEKMIGEAFCTGIDEYAAQTGEEILKPDSATIMEEVGKPIQAIFSTLFPLLRSPQQQELSGFILRALQEKVRSKKGRLLPGVIEVLQHLSNHGIHFGLASNGRAPYLDAILETYSLSPFFPDRAIIDGARLPDKASLILHAMDRYKINREETLMVGDRMTDYEAAVIAGVDFACVLSGHGNDFSDESFSHSIHDLAELFPIVLGGDNAGI